MLRPGMSWLLLTVMAAAVAGEPEEWPHVKDMQKCPRCSAAFDGAPHPTGGPQPASFTREGAEPVFTASWTAQAHEAEM